MIDYTALKTELTTDPNAYGLTDLYNNGLDSACADMLNEVRGSIEVNRGVVPAHEVFEAIVPAEWAALDAQEQTRIGMILGMSEIDTAGANTQAAFLAAFAAGTATRTALIALTKRSGSRAEELFGQSVTREDIRKARIA